jgi:hypothetical protein
MNPITINDNAGFTLASRRVRSSGRPALSARCPKRSPALTSTNAAGTPIELGVSGSCAWVDQERGRPRRIHAPERAA